jgi:hypothetical protein
MIDADRAETDTMDERTGSATQADDAMFDGDDDNDMWDDDDEHAAAMSSSRSVSQIQFASSHRVTVRQLIELERVMRSPFMECPYAGGFFLDWFHSDAGRTWPLPSD